MNKKIEDYLPYYIGQEVFGSYKTPFDIKGKLVGLNVSGQWIVQHSPFVDYAYSPEEIKPILRPLSDMTREEAIFYASLHRNMDGYTGNVLIKPGNNSDTHIKFSTESWGMSLFVGGEKSSYKPQSFHYLLKQGFDLFSLIEAGLAVDKTKPG